jgi:Type II intron maturase/Reverse transcriptase (RNA-dependent DNA polymerase)
LPIFRSEPRSGNDRVRNQGRFRNIVEGGIVSPILANIYLDKLDEFVEQTLIPEFTRGEDKRTNRAYSAVKSRMYRLKAKGASETDLRPLRRGLRRLGAYDQFDPDFRRLRYVRYADDFLLGFDGPKEEAERIRGRLRDFLRDHLKLELSPEKTLITHSDTGCARFLGYHITTAHDPQTCPRGSIALRVPPEVIEAKAGRYMRGDNPIHRPELVNESDFAIVNKYGQEYRGIVQYYAYAVNRYWFTRLHWVMRGSLLKTLASKHKSSVTKMARRLSAEVYHQGRMMACLQVKVERNDKEYIAQFGGLRLRTDKFMWIEDRPFEADRTPHHSRSDLIQRLMAEECEICGSKEKVQVHHVRKLADLKKRWQGRREKPLWVIDMIARRRKTLVVCHDCHVAIHAGKPTRTRPPQDVVIGD